MKKAIRGILGQVLLAGAGSLAAMGTQLASAQAQEGDRPDSQSAGGVQEIVVTATRRESGLQDVPIAVSAVTGESLERIGITDTRQLTQTIPALVFSRSNTTFQPYIRGVGTRNANTGDESAVAVYIDGVYQPIMAALGFDLINIERIEVLRGPQGTLFGRNSTGGLINVITYDPSHEFSGRVLVRGGNYDQRSIQGYMTGGLGDTLAADLSVYSYRDGGYIRDLVRGGHVGDRESDAVRAKLLWEPAQRFRLVLTGSWSETWDASAQNNQPFGGNTAARTSDPVPLIPTSPWQSAIENVLQAGSEQTAFDLQMRYAFDSFNLETTSSVQRNVTLSQTDNDGTTKPLANAIVDVEAKYTSHEVRLVSTTDTSLEWIAGAYFFRGTGRFDPLRSFANGNLTLTGFTRQDVSSWAIFAEGTYKFSDHWHLTTGARYTREDREYDARTINAAGVVGTVPKQKTDFSEVTYRAALQYRFSDSGNAYLSHSRGFKSGVYNGFATSEAAAVPTRPEILNATEIGLKVDPLPWLRTNVAVFYYDYKDIQQSARTPGGGSLITLVNAASAEIKGGEVELTLLPTDRLSVRAYATYLDGSYKSFPTAQIFEPRTSDCPIAGESPCGNVSISPYDASGKDMIRAPRNTFGLNVLYERDTQYGQFGFTGNLMHSAKYYWDFQNRISQPSYTMISSELSWSPNDAWRLAIWGRNLTNEVVYAQVLSSAQGDVVGFEAPRTYGVSVSLNF